MTYICFKCEKKINIVESLLSHLKIIHPFLQNFECKQSNCPRSFSNLSSFKKHYILEHKNFCSSSDTATNTYNHELQEIQSVIDCDVEIQQKSQLSESNIKYNLKYEILAFISSLYSSSSMPRNEIQIIINKFRDLLASVLNCTCDVLKSLGLKHTVITKLSETFNEAQDLLSVFKSEYLCFKYFKKSNSFIAPETYRVGERSVVKQKNTSQQPEMIFKNIEIQVIPLRKLLKKYLVTKYV